MNPIERLEAPVVAAPMAGGPSTPQLVIDAARAGGWGVLAGGNKDVEVMAKQVQAVQDAGFAAGVNLFIPGPQSTDAEALASLRAKMAPVAERFGAELGEPTWDDDAYPQKVEWLTEHPIDVVTFTFGLPSADDVAVLHEVGSMLGATVTSASDARAALDRGLDFLIVQGPDAGGHQSTFDPSDEPVSASLDQLLADVRSAVESLKESQVPLIAAGGIATPDDVQRALDQGAAAVQVGTAFLRSSSAGSSPTHRAALASPAFTMTTLTRAFSGRPARGLANEFAAAFHDISPAAYPEVNRMLGPVRAAAAASGDAQWTHLWAGTGWRRTAEAMPDGLIDADATAITRWLAGV